VAAKLHADVCVIGAGSGGLSVAAGASQMGARTILIEKGRMGGDCLNYGCVPSKALLAAAHAATRHRNSAAFGIGADAPAVDFARVHAHVHGVIDTIAPMDSEARFAAMGVQVLRGTARFTGPRTVAVGDDGDTRVRARWFVVATGSRPAAPPIDGLDQVPYLTNETVFDLTELPGHLVIVGGGPIGIEMAQAFRRLGAEVTVVEGARILGPGDPELVQLLRDRLRAEGVALREGAAVKAVRPDGAGVALDLAGDAGGDGATETVAGSHLLVAAGRAPNVDDLGLDAAGVAFDRKGVTVDAGLRSTNRRVFAVGDAAGGPQFTHLAGYHAGVVIRRMLFRMFWAKADLRALPAVTYTEPELAQVGLSEAAARAKGPITVLRWPFAENDRAQAERTTDGLIKVLATPKGKILGVHILGPQAGELIQPWVLALQNGLKIRHMAGTIAPYPTLGEVGKRAAGTFYYPTLFSARTRRVVRWLMRLA
jgi:pyruvate/2-oxoglutarate dehydrogenase complex dihydrolipoamide dehydrogenase (E3) component